MLFVMTTGSVKLIGLLSRGRMNSKGAWVLLKSLFD
jgi:hypothetical protein